MWTIQTCYLRLCGLTRLSKNFWRVFSWRPWNSPSKTQASPSTYQAPTWWDDKPKAEKNFFLSWDQLFWQIEQQQPTPTSPPPIMVPFNAASALLLSAMGQSGHDRFKRNLATFLSDSQRFAYLPHLIPGLNTQRSSPATRMAIAGAMQDFYATGGLPVFSTAVKQGLLRQYNIESHAYAKSMLGDVLTSLGVPH